MKNIIKIVALSNEIEAMLIDSLLNEKGIPHMLKTYHDTVYDGLWQTQSSWGHLEAPEEYREEILEIYNSMSQE